MRHGLFLPAFDELADPERLAGLAASAERAGWDGFFLWDHVLYPGPVVDILDPWICLALVAEHTGTIRLGPMVTPIARRRPVVLARQAATLDVLSHGRLVLGFGLGDDSAGEFSRFGDEPTPVARAALLDEGVPLVRQLIRGDAVEHGGPNYQAAGVRLLPRSPQPGGPPIWLGARWPRRAPIRRAAAYDGVIAIHLQEPRDVVSLREVVAAAGADMDRFEIVVVGSPGQDHRPWRDAGVTWWLTQFGPYELVAAAVQRTAEEGPPPG